MAMFSPLASVPHPVGDMAHDKSTAGAASWSRRRRVGTCNLDWPKGGNGASADAAGGNSRCSITRHGSNNDRLSTLWREVISLAGIARSFSSGGLKRTGATMKIQVRCLAIALAIAVPIAVSATTKSSAAPINGTSIKAAVPAVTTDVRYQVRRGHPYPSYWGYPAYSSYWGYPTYNSNYGAYGYGYYRSACAPGPRVGAFATEPWTDAPTCPPY
jgi:hypothetical protein